MLAQPSRAISAVLFTASLLFAAPVSAATGEFQIAVAPIEFVGEVPEYLRDDVRNTIAAALAKIDVKAVMLDSDCRSPQCTRRAASELDSGLLLELRLVAMDRSYEMELVLFESAHGRELARSTDVCNICGHDTLLTEIFTRVLNLRSALALGMAPPKVLVSGSPPGAAVVLDGVVIGHTPIELEVSAGSHLVEVQAPGHAAQTHRWDATVGIDEVLEYSLATTSPTRRHGARIGGWVSVALGFAAVGVGATLLALDGADHGPTCGPEQRDRNGACPNVYTTRVGGIVGLSVGAAALAGGAGLLIYAARRDRAAPVAVLAPSGLGLSLSF